MGCESCNIARFGVSNLSEYFLWISYAFKTKYLRIGETPWIPSQLTSIKTGDLYRKKTPLLPDAS
jgi:hypothetical protein